MCSGRNFGKSIFSAQFGHFNNAIGATVSRLMIPGLLDSVRRVVSPITRAVFFHSVLGGGTRATLLRSHSYAATNGRRTGIFRLGWFEVAQFGASNNGKRRYGQRAAADIWCRRRVYDHSSPRARQPQFTIRHLLWPLCIRRRHAIHHLCTRRRPKIDKILSPIRC